MHGFQLDSRAAAGRISRVAAVAVTAGLAAACAGIGLPGAGGGSATPVERERYAAALSSLPQDEALAAARLAAFVDQFPRSALADDAAEKLAVLATGRGEPRVAIGWLERSLLEVPGGDRVPAMRLELAHLLDAQGDAEQARRALERLRFDALPLDEQERGYRLAMKLSRTPAARLAWLSKLRATLTSDVQRAAVDDEADLLMQRMSVPELETALSRLEGRIPAARVALRLAERALDVGDPQRAGEWITRADGLVQSEADTRLRDALALRQASGVDGGYAGAGPALPSYDEVSGLRVPRTDGARGTIGVVLPLSGPFARFGEESLRGILLATRVFGSERGDGVRVVVRDSQGDAGRAAEAVRELGERGDIVAIVGPLLSGEAEAAAQMAESMRVPLLTLTSREEVARNREFVFRLRTTPADEVEALVEHAMGALGARRFAILYPDDSFGRGMRGHFWRSVEARGGAVTGVARYSPDANDFAEPIRSLVGYRLLTRAEQEALRERNEALEKARRLPSDQAAELRRELMAELGPDERPLPPIVDFDALFIPDSHEKVVLLAPQLSFHDVRGVQLLGSDGWNHPDVPRIGKQHVRGAVISSLFHRDSRFPFVADFVSRYADAYGSDPDVFAASAHDAANLVLLQLVAGRATPGSVREGIGEVRAFPGASGVATIGPDGNARKRPFLLGISSGRIESLD